ncbi:hypothetical protein PQX77_010505 [Marasmius sp. AFHP31]|nr:hypothetical protein PQX77_010505 [Marasmius sp. AFHP31]
MGPPTPTPTASSSSSTQNKNKTKAKTRPRPGFIQLEGSDEIFWQPRSFWPHDDKDKDKEQSSSSVSYTEFRAPNSPPPNTLGVPGDIYIGETEARLFARYDSGWFEWTSTRFEEEDGEVVVHPAYGGCVLWIEKDVVGWVRRRWLRGKGRVRMLKTPQGLVQGVINSKRKPGQSQSQSQAPPTFSQPPPSSSSSFPSISQPSSPAVNRIRSQPSLNLSQALPISVPKPFSTFTIRPPRPLTKAQQVRQLQDGEAGIDADATKAENEILTKENRELKKRVRELEVEVRELKEDLAAQRKKRRKRKREEVAQHDEPMPIPMSIPSPPPSTHPDADRSASPSRSPSRLPTPVSALPVQTYRSTPASVPSTKRKRAEPEPEPTPEAKAKAPTPSPISPSSTRSAAPSLPTHSIESAPIPPQLDQSSVLPTRAALPKRKQVNPDPTPLAPRVKDVLANLKFTKRALSSSKRKRPDPEPTPEAPVSPFTSTPTSSAHTTIHPSRGTGVTQELRASPLAPPRLTKRKRGPGTFEPGSDLPNVTQASSPKRRRVPGTFEAGSVPPLPPPPHPPVPFTKRKDVVGAGGPPLERLFTPPPGGEDHRGQGDSVMKKRRVSESREEDEEEEQSVKKSAFTSHGKPSLSSSKSAAPTSLRQPSSSITNATPVPAPVEGPLLDRIFTPTPEPELQKRGMQMKPSVRSGVMTMKTSASTPTAGGKSKPQPSLKPAVRATPTPSSSSSLPPPRKQSAPTPNCGASSSSSAGAGTNTPAVPLPPPSSSIVKVKQEISASLSTSTTTFISNNNGVIDLTFLDSEDDEEDEEPPKKKREVEVIVLSDSDDDEVDGEVRVSGSASASGLDYGTGTSRSHSRSEEEVLGMDVDVDADVDAGRGEEGEGEMDVDVDLPDTNQDEEMQHEPSTSTNNDPPQMDTDPPPIPSIEDDPISPPPITVKPDTPSSWDLHHIPPPYLLSSYISIFYHLGKKNRLYCRKCAEERSHRNLWKKFNVGESTWGMLRHVEREHTSWYERVCGMGEEEVGGVVEGLRGGGGV